MRVDAEACGFEPVERLPVRRKGLTTIHEHVVDKHVEFPSRDQPRIKLPNRAGRSVAWIHEACLSRFFALGVGFFENIARYKDLATHFEPVINRFGFETQRHAANRARILCDVFTDAPRSEEHTSELQSRFGISYAVFCL